MPFLLAQAQQAPVPAVGLVGRPWRRPHASCRCWSCSALLGGCLWLIRRGGWQGGLRKGPRAVQIETAVGLGDRRQLVIVSVEGRRLLLGVTPMHVGAGHRAVAAAPSFAEALGGARCPAGGTRSDASRPA